MGSEWKGHRITTDSWQPDMQSRGNGGKKSWQTTFGLSRLQAASLIDNELHHLVMLLKNQFQ